MNNPQTTLQKLTDTVRSTLNMASSLPKTYRHAVFKEKGGPLTIEEVELKMPGKGEVLVKTEACGVCHSDVLAQYDIMGGGLYVLSSSLMIVREYLSGTGCLQRGTSLCSDGGHTSQAIEG
jgi:hypothetical protein